MRYILTTLYINTHKPRLIIVSIIRSGILCRRDRAKYHITAARPLAILSSTYDSLFGIVDFRQFTIEVLRGDVSRYAFIAMLRCTYKHRIYLRCFEKIHDLRSNLRDHNIPSELREMSTSFVFEISDFSRNY